MPSFSQYLFETYDADQNKRIIFIDEENIEDKFAISDYFKKQGYEVYYSSKTPIVFGKAKDTSPNSKALGEDLIDFETIKTSDKQILVIIRSESDIPNEIRDICCVKRINFEEIFPELNPKAIKEKILTNIQLDLLCFTLSNNPPINSLNYSETLEFISKQVFNSDNIFCFIKALEISLDNKALVKKQMNNKPTPYDWYEILNQYADLELLAVESDLDSNYYNEIQKEINKSNVDFQEYLLENYCHLHNFTSLKSPILINNVLDFIYQRSKKFALIVMDGMSFFDWKAISYNFKSIKFNQSFALAMIPTITSISRQSLLSGKFPKNLEKIWDLSMEEKEFKESAKNLGYKEYEVSYLKKKLSSVTQLSDDCNNDFLSIENNVTLNTKALAVVINDIDDLVHQSRNRKALLNSIKEYNISEKLENLINSLIKNKFDIFITADHGNTQCIGMGNCGKNGVETTSKGKRMLVLKNYANKTELISKYNLIELPKDYLKEDYDYFVCPLNKAFDAPNNKFMSHGGITLDEVIVPFIEVKEKKLK